MARVLFPLAVLVLAGALAGADDSPAERGKKVFEDSMEFTVPSCAHCHSLLPPEEEAKKAGHLGPGASLYGAAKRAGWRNMKTYEDVGDASQHCAKNYQERRKGLGAREREDLVAFLSQHAPEEPLPMRKVQRRPKMLEELDGGDAASGGKLYLKYCTGCHNDGEEAIYNPIPVGRKKRVYIVRKVRGYDTRNRFKPGTMSYYTNDRLPDEDLLDILAYLGK